MSGVQKFFMAVLPRGWAESMRKESQEWMVRCDCGYERSAWELGWVRWKAKGSPRRYLDCPKCGKSSWHKMYWGGGREGNGISEKRG